MKKILFSIFSSLLPLVVAAQSNEQSQQADSIPNDSIWRSEVLDSVVVKGSKVVHDMDKDVWTITDEMRHGTYDTNELVGKIPGFFYNRSSRSLTYMGRDNIRFLINGIEKEADFVGMLVNKRFHKIEITQHPTGRYQDYDVVVNLISRNEWLGYEGIARGTFSAAPSGDTNETAPYSFFSFTSPHIDASANYSFKHNDEWKNVRIAMTEQNLLRYNTLEDKISSEYSQKNIHYAWADADYRINKKQIVSFKYSFVVQDNNMNSRYQMEKSNIPQNTSQVVERNSRDDVQKRYHAFSVYYRGEFKGWNLYSNITYSRQHDFRYYNFSEQNYQTSTNTDNTYNVLQYNADANINVGKSNRLNFGLQGLYRNLTDGLSENRQEISYNSMHHRFYGKLSHRFTPNISGSVGGVAEYSHTHSFGGLKDRQFLWGGNAQLRLSAMNNKLSASMNYRYQLSYPTLVQLSTVRRTLDSLTVSSGNSGLKHTANHYISADISYSKFGLWAFLNHDANQIEPVYKTTDGMIWQTYDNMRNSSLFLMAFYKDQIQLKNAALTIDLDAEYNTTALKYGSERKSVSWFGTSCGLTYQHDKLGDLTMVYWFQPRKGITLQSTSYVYNKDGVELVYAKRFCKNKLLLQINYQLPLKWAADYQSYSNTYTPAYTREYSYDSFSIKKNMLNILVIYRLAHGREVRKLTNQQATAE